MRSGDVATALVFLMLAVGVTAGVRDLEVWNAYGPGPALAAYCVAGLICLVGALLLMRTIRHPEYSDFTWPERAAGLRVLRAIAVLCGFAFLLPVVGFVISGVLFMGVMLIFIQRRPVVPSLVTIAVTMTVAYAVFVLWLAIDLPTSGLGV